MISKGRAEAVNADQVAFWNAEAGETWAAMREALDRQIEPLGLAAMQALATEAGERVIDIGCGCGQTTLALAKRVGAGGAVLGVDISTPMLKVARERARRSGLDQARFLQADAQTYAFEPGGARAAFSRFGVMFFDDPAAAFANIRAALSPGGRLAFVCWRTMGLNPWMTVPLAAALTHIQAPPPPDPMAPGPFAFADRDRVRRILAQAGFAAIDVAPHDQAIGGGDLEQALGAALRIGPLGRLLREQPGAAGVVADSVRAALAPHETPAGVFLGSASWIVTAVNG